MAGVPLIFQRLSVGTEKEKVRALGALIRAYSSEEDSFEANDAVRSLVGLNRVDAVIGTLVLEYNQASKMDLKLRILKVIGWLFSRLWADNSVDSAIVSSAFGQNSFKAVDLYIQCLFSNHLTPKLWTFLGFIHQAIPSVIMRSERNRYACLLVELLDGLTFVCTGLYPIGHPEHTTNPKLKNVPGMPSAAWVLHPVEVHQSFLTALLNIIYQVIEMRKCTPAGGKSLVSLLRRHCVSLVDVIVGHYLGHSCHMLSVYALHTLQVLYPAKYITDVAPGASNLCGGEGIGSVHLRYELTCGGVPSTDLSYFNQFASSIGRCMSMLMGRIW
jgi:hypothetical protein